MKIFDARQIAIKKIQSKNLDISVVNLILEDALDLSHQEILIKNIQNLEPIQESRFFFLLEEYLKNERPIQYILGYSYFYGRKYIVNPNVLIPRFETEEMVYNSIKIIKNNNYKIIADIGTGSGNIAISISKEIDNIKVLGVDISIEALEVSKNNAIRLDSNVIFHQSNLLEYFIDNNIKVDMIISNPPYIDVNDEEVDEIVRRNEPSLALFAKDNGLYNYKKIINDAHLVLNKNGSIIFEIGYKQGEILKKYVEDKFPNYRVEIIKDIDKKNRMLYIKIVE